MFKVAGVSVLKGEVKVRFANDMTRVKVLAKNGHTDIELRELPEAMDKPAVVTYLKTTDLYTDSRLCIDDCLFRHLLLTSNRGIQRKPTTQ